MDCSTPGSHVHCQLPELIQTHVHWICDDIQPAHALSSLLLLPSIFPSIRVFSNESVLRNRWPKYWSFSFISSPSSEYSGWISFRIDWFDLLAVQGTYRGFLQHHSSRALVPLHELIVWMWESDHKENWAQKYWSTHIAPLFWISFPFRSPQSTR